MSIRFLLSSALALSTMTLVMAESKTVTVTEAGTLQSQFTTDEMTSVTELTVSGPINKTDLAFVNGSLTALETLNLQQSNIVEETIETTTYPANEMPSEVFENNKIIKSISFPSTLTSIGARAFEYSNIQSPDFSTCPKLEIIGKNAFATTPYLKGVNLSQNAALTTIEESAFNTSGDKLSEIGIEETTIDFSGCSSLKIIGEYAFNQHKISTKIIFDGCTSLESIGNRAFNNSKVTIIDLSDCINLTEIPRGIFNQCSKVNKIILPKNLKKIEAEAFKTLATSRLESVISLAVEVPDLEENGFPKGFTNAILSVPKETKEKYKAHTEWSKFSDIIEDASLSVESTYTESLKVSVQNNIIKIYNIEEGATINIYNVRGALVATQVATDNYAEISLPVSGIYIIKSGKSIAKVML